MTGFAREEGRIDDYVWVWEVKSVNGRGLDFRCRVPQGYDELDARARQAAQKRFKRGSLSLNLSVNHLDGSAGLAVNRELLDQVLALGEDLKGRVEDAKPRLEGLLAIRGIVEPVSEVETPELRAARIAAMEATLGAALDALVTARQSEGARMADVVAGHVDEIARLTDDAEGVAALQPKAIKERLAANIQDLLEADTPLSEERLAQEAALLANKADVREELDRLRAHIEAARELLAKGGSIGRQLDFLCQEFNRESNTICSKAQDLELTRIGLAFKSVIDQFREQVQNIE